MPFHGRSEIKYVCPWVLARELSLMAPFYSTLIGWSMGGVIAIMMKLLFPLKFRRVIVIGGSAYMLSCLGEDALRGFILRLKRKPEEIQSFRKLALGKDFRDKIDIKQALRLLLDISKIDLRAKVRNLHITVIHGKEDKVISPKCGLELARLSGGRFLLVEGEHMPGGIFARSAALYG
ncbi:MAG: alpha/beta hydrolase [Aquificaceae bacterium]